MELSFGGQVLLVVALILLNGVFAGAEIAILTIRKSRLEQLSEAGSSRAKAVLALRRRPERFLATVQIGITVVGATAAALSGASLARRLEPWLASITGVEAYAEELALVMVVTFVSYLSLVLGELVPKSIALRSAEIYALWMGKGVRLLSYLMRPAVWLLTASSNAVLRPLGDQTSFVEARLSPEELEQLLDEAAEAGTLDVDSGKIASRAVHLSELYAVDMMTPRNRMKAIAHATPADEVWRKLLDCGHTRVPVFGTSLDDIVGYVVLRDLLPTVDSGAPRIALDSVLRPAYFVPEMMPANRLLQTMRAHHNMAIVVDEHGGVSGLITLEDVMEELVGEIVSEREMPEQLIVREKDGTYLVQGHAQVRDVNRELDIELPEGDAWSTVGGLCLALAGRFPENGAVLQAGEWQLEITDVTQRRVRWVRMRKSPLLPSEREGG